MPLELLHEIVYVYVNNKADWFSVCDIQEEAAVMPGFNLKVILSLWVYWYQVFISASVCVRVRAWQRKVDEAGLGPRDLISHYHPIITFRKLPLTSSPCHIQHFNNTLDTSHALYSPGNRKCCCAWDLAAMMWTQHQTKHIKSWFFVVVFFISNRVEKQIWAHYFSRWRNLEHQECPLKHEPAVTERKKS